ncbi:acyl-CoA N-acyltransferase [Xylariaceae sp. FL1272]|nr:acyl-CoA N-acyltransferase [Xylariaceae sp. FL1272]
MSISKSITVRIEPFQYADIPACARITSHAFSIDPYTIVKQLGQKPFDMYDIAQSDFLNTLHRRNYVYVKAVDSESGEIVGHAGWSFRGLPNQDLVPWNGPSDEKPETEVAKTESDNAAEHTDAEPEGGHKENSSIDRLHAIEDADMQYWIKDLLPSDMPCVLVQGLIVSPSHQSRGVGSALLQYGNAMADGLGLPVWVHSSHQAYEVYRKAGFKTVRELDIDLDEYAPRAPREDEDVMGEKGCGKWGRYVIRYMRRKRLAEQVDDEKGE